MVKKMRKEVGDIVTKGTLLASGLALMSPY